MCLLKRQSVFPQTHKHTPASSEACSCSRRGYGPPGVCLAPPVKLFWREMQAGTSASELLELRGKRNGALWGFIYPFRRRRCVSFCPIKSSIQKGGFTVSMASRFALLNAKSSNANSKLRASLQVD